jgi:hypothetical protein
MMQTLYKLTDQQGYTRRGQTNECLWGEGITHSATGHGGLCTAGVIHAYEHPLLAVFMNPIHANLRNPLLWECEGEIFVREGQLKCGCKKLTTCSKISLPSITLEQRVRIAIYCALAVYKEKHFVTWAEKWLNGTDRTSGAASYAASYAARYAASDAASYAARCAARYACFDLLSIIKSVVLEGK